MHHSARVVRLVPILATLVLVFVPSATPGERPSPGSIILHQPVGRDAPAQDRPQPTRAPAEEGRGEAERTPRKKRSRVTSTGRPGTGDRPHALPDVDAVLAGIGNLDEIRASLLANRLNLPITDPTLAHVATVSQFDTLVGSASAPLSDHVSFVSAHFPNLSLYHDLAEHVERPEPIRSEVPSYSSGPLLDLSIHPREDFVGSGVYVVAISFAPDAETSYGWMRATVRSLDGRQRVQHDARLFVTDGFEISREPGAEDRFVERVQLYSGEDGIRTTIVSVSVFQVVM